MIGKESMVSSTDYVYSAEDNAFFPLSLRESYESAGSWPKKYVNVSAARYVELRNGIDMTHRIMPDKDGYPQLVEIDIDYGPMAEEERESRMQALTKEIDFIVAAIEDDDATKEEEEKLPKLRALRSKIRRMDLSAYPNVEWPTL